MEAFLGLNQGTDDRHRLVKVNYMHDSFLYNHLHKIPNIPNKLPILPNFRPL